MLSVQAAPRTSTSCACCGKPVSLLSIQDNDLAFLRVTLTGHAELIHWGCAKRLGLRKQLVTVLWDDTPETGKFNALIQWFKRFFNL